MLLDSAPGTPYKFGNTDTLVYGAHVEAGGDLHCARLIGEAAPGTIIAQRDGAVAVQCGDVCSRFVLCVVVLLLVCLCFAPSHVCLAMALQGAVWLTHMKRQHNPRALPAVKLPSMALLPPSLLRDVPVLPSLSSVLRARPSTFQDVWATVAAGVAYVNFPFYNGVTRQDQARALAVCFRDVCARDDVRVVVLLGGGLAAFSNGMDFNAVHAAVNPFGTAWATMNACTDLVRDILVRSDKLVVSALQGSAASGGAMLAAACDAVWAHEDVILNPHYKALGVHGSDYWTYTLPRRTGAAVARQLTFGLQPLTASAALACGLVDELLPAPEFMDAVVHRATQLADDKPGLAHLLARKSAHLSADTLESMHRARMYESIIMRDNLKEAGHAALRAHLVDKTVPKATPLYLAGQRAACGRVLDGKQLAKLKMDSMKTSVSHMKEVRL